MHVKHKLHVRSRHWFVNKDFGGFLHFVRRHFVFFTTKLNKRLSSNRNITINFHEQNTHGVTGYISRMLLVASCE